MALRRSIATDAGLSASEDSDSDAPYEQKSNKLNDKRSSKKKLGDLQNESDDFSEDEGEELTSDSDDADEKTLEEKVSQIPLGARVRMLGDGRGPVGVEARLAARKATEAQADFHRANRHRPAEMSSKRAVPRHRDVIQAPNNAPRDPRFDEMSGDLDLEKFRKRYAFLYDEIMPEEQQQLKEKMNKARNVGQQRALQADLTRMSQALTADKLKRKQEELEQEWKAKETAAVAGGKKPFFLKKADRKKLELVAKYQELKKAGRLDKYMEKRRRKNAAKDHRYVPSERRAAE